MAKTLKSKKSARRYILEISETQAKLISIAAEFYARLGTGQFKQLERFFWNNLEQAQPHLDILHVISNGLLHSYGSIRSSSIDDDYRVLYDLHQVIRHRLAWDRNPNPERLISTDFNSPWRASKKEPLAKIDQTTNDRKSS